MFADFAFAEARRWCGRVRGEWVDEVVPGQVELLPHSGYGPAYGWMYAYEKRLRRRIEEARGRRLGGRERWLFGEDGIVSEALSNAFLHGHGRDPLQPIRVEVAAGTAGLALAVEDRGEGFDVEGVLAKLHRGGTYFHTAGNGMRTLARNPEVKACYGDGGRRLLLFVPLG